MEEPNALMRWVMFHFAGGDALFAALLVGLTLSFLPVNVRYAWRITLITLVTVIWGALSSPAWPILGMVVVLVFVVIWRLDAHLSPTVGRRPISYQFFFQSALFIALFAELAVMNNSWRPNKLVPQELAVIADSITAGLNDGETTWPRLYAERTGISVHDASQPGATLKSALKQAELLDNDSPLILEIGGNDLLSGLPVDQFANDCEILLQRVCQPDRTVWMTELPLPPLCSRYGVVQRRLCRRYGVRLIPKRQLMAVLTTQGATVDSIHLSPKGQQLLCDVMMGATGNLAATSVVSPRYERLNPVRN